MVKDIVEILSPPDNSTIIIFPDLIATMRIRQGQPDRGVK